MPPDLPPDSSDDNAQRGIEFGWRVHSAQESWTAKVDGKASLLLALQGGALPWDCHRAPEGWVSREADRVASRRRRRRVDQPRGRDRRDDRRRDAPTWESQGASDRVRQAPCLLRTLAPLESG